MEIINFRKESTCLAIKHDVMYDMIENIEMVCSVITALSTIFIGIQLFQTARAEKKHHEEMRRIKTVEIMENWSKSLKKETSFAEKIVEGFTEEQCRWLYFKEEFELDCKKAGIYAKYVRRRLQMPIIQNARIVLPEVSSN